MGGTTRRRSRLQGTREKLGLSIKCPKGTILRAPYKRSFKSTVKRSGFNVKRGNKTVHIFPKSGSTIVKASCVKDQGLPGKGPGSGKGIGPLKQGELTKYGYNIHKSTDERHVALRKAIAVYGALSVFRKLTAVANLTLRTAPEAHSIFKEDLKWVQKNYTLKKQT
jgi:hypothetical protein